MSGVCSLCGDPAHAANELVCPRTGLPTSTVGPCGTQIDRYRVDRWLGTGGMGAVYEARHMHLAQPVAMKILQSHLATNATVVERFVREAQAAAAIGNRHIVRIFDFGVAPSGQPFFVMEMLEGADLESLIEAGAPFPVAWSVDIALQILNGLGAAHAAGIVHRDLKPGNVFLTGVPGTASGSGDFVKILDFGISKVLHEGGSTLTGPGIVLGTPAYMAPEQARGARDLDHRVDIYATCVILYELLSGRLPHEGASLEDLLVRLCTEPPRPLREIAPHLGDDVLAVVDRGLSRDPEARFHSARELSEALLAVRIPDGDPSSIVSVPGLTGAMRSFRSDPSGASSPGWSHHPVGSSVVGVLAAAGRSPSESSGTAPPWSSEAVEGASRRAVPETREGVTGPFESAASSTSPEAFAPTMSAMGAAPIASTVTGSLVGAQGAGSPSHPEPPPPQSGSQWPQSGASHARSGAPPAARASSERPERASLQRPRSESVPSTETNVGARRGAERSGGAGVWIALVSVSLVALAALSILAAIGLSQIQPSASAGGPAGSPGGGTGALVPITAPTSAPPSAAPTAAPGGTSAGGSAAIPNVPLPPNGVAALLPLLGIDPDEVASIPGPIQSAPPPTDGVGIGVPFSNSGVDPLSVSDALERSRPRLLACRQPGRTVTVRVAAIIQDGAVANTTPNWDNNGDLSAVQCVGTAFTEAARARPLRGSGIVSFEIALGPA